LRVLAQCRRVSHLRLRVEPRFVRWRLEATGTAGAQGRGEPGLEECLGKVFDPTRKEPQDRRRLDDRVRHGSMLPETGTAGLDPPAGGRNPVQGVDGSVGVALDRSVNSDTVWAWTGQLWEALVKGSFGWRVRST